MSEQRVSFKSRGLALAGVVRLPDGTAPRERRAAFIVLHGFGSNMGSGNVLGPCALLDELGYATLRFDMPGCGESEGERGRLICLEQVEAVRDAVTLLARHPAVDPSRIAVLGSSFGAAVAVYAGGVDQRLAAVVSGSGWGHGEKKFRGQHPTPQAWAKFTAMLEEGKRHRA
jgi:pimeloyl-ACP methyl ester carboxylesterase